MSEESPFTVIRQLADYEVWCNARALETAGGLSSTQLFQSFPFGFKTIHATLFHTVEVFQTWSGCVGPTISKPAMVPYDATMTLAQMTQWNARLSVALIKAFDDSHRAGVLHLDRRLVQLFHLVTHGTHHRTQFITMLRLLGLDPPYEPGDFGGWSQGR
ncbi:MAG: DinB family protein [Phycisphaeraceae bacterium]